MFCSVACKAYEELHKPEMKEKYKLVIGEAKRRVVRQIEKENRKLAQGEFTADGVRFGVEWM